MRGNLRHKGSLGVSADDILFSTKLEYVDAKTLVSSSEDGTMRVWSVHTGAPKEELDRGSFAFSKDGSLEHKVGGQVQYHLQEGPVFHLRRGVSGGLLP
jgi:hypothetical protein